MMQIDDVYCQLTEAAAAGASAPVAAPILLLISRNSSFARGSSEL